MTATLAVPEIPALRTRKPTRTVAPPVILLDGMEGTGKSTLAALLTASPRVGRCLWMQLGETVADEYETHPGANYEIIEHDGSWPSIYGQILAAREAARAAHTAGEPPVVFTFDTVTAEWDMQHAYVDSRNRASQKNAALLREDPNAELPKAGRHIWNDANGRHDRMMTVFRTFPGIVILIARGKWVSATDPATGQPLVVRGKPVKTWRTEAQQQIGFECSLWIRLQHGEPAQVIRCNSTKPGIGVRAGEDEPAPLPDGWSLDDLIFNKLGYLSATSPARDLPMPVVDLTPEQIRDEVCDPRTSPERLGELAALVEVNRWDAALLTNGHGDEEALRHMISRTLTERGGNGGPVTRPATPPPPARSTPPRGGQQGRAPLHVVDPPVTAPAWLTNTREKISRLQNRAAGNSLWEQVIAPTVRAGRCTEQDALTLKAEMAARLDLVDPKPAADRAGAA